MIEFAPKKHRRQVANLPLTAMIDIFSLLVIFLIKSTVFGVADIDTANLKLPTSVSKETIESAPEVIIAKNKVHIAALQADYPLSVFRPSEAGSAQTRLLKSRMKEFVAHLSPEAKSSGVLLNVVADKDTPYQDVFDTVRLFRESGFQTLMFVATGESGGNQ